LPVADDGHVEVRVSFEDRGYCYDFDALLRRANGSSDQALECIKSDVERQLP
jgi:hypothetical protein